MGTSNVRNTLFTTGALLLALTAMPALHAQEAPETPLPGSGLTRPELIERLSAAERGTTVSPERGRAIYEEVCAACHIFGETGNTVGPDLTTLSSRFSRRDVLDAILYPSKTISDQYLVEVFTLDDGSYASGVVVRETPQAVFLQTVESGDALFPVLQRRITERAPSTVSLMPEALVAAYSLDEIDSLVAYILGE